MFVSLLLMPRYESLHLSAERNRKCTRRQQRHTSFLLPKVEEDEAVNAVFVSDGRRALVIARPADECHRDFIARSQAHT